MGMFSSSRTLRTPTWAMPRANQPPRARPMPTCSGCGTGAEDSPESPRRRACTERLILSRLFTGNPTPSRLCPAMLRCHPRLNLASKMPAQGRLFHGTGGRARLRRQGNGGYQPSPGSMTNSCVSDNLKDVVREISAGGVVVRHTAEGWQIAVIEPQKEPSAGFPAKARQKTAQKMLLALPKG